MKKILLLIVLLLGSASATFAERRNLNLDPYDPLDPTNPFAEQPLSLYDSSYKSATDAWIEFQQKEIQKKKASYDEARRQHQKTVSLLIRYFFIALAIMFMAAGIFYHTVIANGWLHRLKKTQTH